VIAEGTGTSDKMFYTLAPGAIGGIICRDWDDDETSIKYWYHCDRLGNVMAITDAYGNAYAVYTMDAFGKVLEKGTSSGYYYQHAADPQPYHLTTKEYDATTGLYYFGARWYDPTTGRFISREPTRVDGPNLYQFNFNDPVNWFDPNGYDSIFKKVRKWLCDMWSDYLGEWEMPGPFGNPHNQGSWPPHEKWGDPLALERKPPGPGTTAGRICFGVGCAAIGTAVAVGVCEAATGNASTAVLGPSVRNGRIVGIRNPNWWGGKPPHLDFHVIPGSDGYPVLHLNTPAGKHIPLFSLKWLMRLLGECD